MTAAADSTRAPNRRRRTADVVAVGAGTALTLLFAYALAYRPLAGAAALLAFAVAAALVLRRREIGALSLRSLLVGLVLAIPFAALLGPAAGLPAAPQLFAFRLLLVAVAAVGVPVLLLSEARPLDVEHWRPALPLALWAAWLCVALLWSPDKTAGLTYIALLGTMLAVTAATAVAGLTRRRVVAFGITMIAAYAAIVGVTGLEATTGLRLPTSHLAEGAGSQYFAVTSVFHNQNDLAAYLAICWPFLLGVAFFTRRARWLVLAVLLAVPGALAFVRTGSRSSLLAAGVSTAVLLVVLVQPGSWLRTRRASIVGVVLALALLAGATYLLFNDSTNPMLRQFRLSALVEDITEGSGSGSIRSELYRRGLAIAGESLLLGAGPGQTPDLLTGGIGGLGLGNLHNWWIEIYAEGGLPGLLLHLTFVLGLMWGLLRRARAPGDPLGRYLATCAFAALAGFVIGALGPSRTMILVPMWILYGLSLSILVAPWCKAEDTLPGREAAP